MRVIYPDSQFLVSDMSETQILKTLDSNAERRAWEKDFDEQCIQPVFANKVVFLCYHAHIF